jgi:hypothetical protein
MSKVKFLGIGARGKVITVNDTYTERFLYDHGFKRYELVSKYTIDHLTTVQTKYGELVVHANDVVTYVGNGIWSVSRY